MIYKIDTINANESDYGRRLLIYLCTEPEIDYPTIKKEFGIDRNENSKFECYKDKEPIIVLASVGTICSDVLEQILGYAKYAGVSMHLKEIFKEIKKMDE